MKALHRYFLVPELTYTVLGGTLNSTHSLTHSLTHPYSIIPKNRQLSSSLFGGKLQVSGSRYPSLLTLALK